MNQADRKEFETIHNNIEEIKRTVNEIKVEADSQHMMLRQDIKFIKENLFNPHDGLWTETKQNTQFRENTTKWRSVMGVGFVGLMAERVYNFIIGS